MAQLMGVAWITDVERKLAQHARHWPEQHRAALVAACREAAQDTARVVRGIKELRDRWGEGGPA
jgi:hypothetical protein